MSFPKFLRVALMSRGVKKDYGYINLKLLELLSKKLHFSYEIFPVGEFGSPLGGGNWSGMVGMLQHCPDDHLISILVVSEPRTKVIDFSYPIQREKVTFVTRKPEFSPDATSLLWPFSFGMWLAIVVCHFIMPVIFFLLLRKKYTFERLCFSTYQTFVGQDMGMKPKKPREYVLIAFWILGVLLICYCYCALLLSFLTFPILKGVRTIPELATAVAKGKYQCICFPGCFIANQLILSSDPNMKTIGRSLKDNKGSSDISKVLKDAKTKKQAFVAAGDTLLPFERHYFVSDDEFFPALKAIAMRKSFCCRPQLDHVIHHIWSSGLLLKWKSDVGLIESLKILHEPQTGRSKENVQSLSVEDIEGAFILLIFGYLSATIAFISEIALHHGKLYFKNRTMKNLKRNYTKSVQNRSEKFKR